ncbi:MAG: cell surface protein [Myxococcaceae bacterium]|nr:cell surface protein [Myxococcaceae bacterium]
MRRRGRFAFLFLATLAAAGLWWRAHLHEFSTVETHPAAAEAKPEVVQALPRVRRRKSQAVSPDAAPREIIGSSRCISDYAEHCLHGDVWLVDSCGRPEEKVEECGEQPCREDVCELPSTAPCNEPAEGRCDGDTVRLCMLGRPLQIDCAAKGQRCAYGDEGAECQPQVPQELRCDSGAEPTRCERDTLVRCIGGRLVKTPCDSLRARCLQLSGSSAPACILVLPTVVQTMGCGPCGCLVNHPGPETCDGRDQDGDGLVDQGLDCGPVPVMAFIVTGPGGQTSHAREDIEAEIDRANLAFMRTPSSAGLSLVLKEVNYLSDASLLTLDDAEVQALATDPRIHPSSDSFYVPVVFTDEVISGDTPKPGLSTLPNGTCGGMQEGKSPEVGMLAVAKARYPTTVTHELGHFFGLCHTHDQQEATPFSAYANSQTGRLQGCYATCRGEGDGICDTPFDPGPEQCSYDPICRASCQVRATPDTLNLMSYYATCRVHFSDQQMGLMQHTVALRRGWNRCLGGRCECQIGGSECPTEMSCRPVILSSGEAGNRCGFDGPRGAGADCQSPADCGQGTVCMTQQAINAQRCVRPCTSSSADCSCTGGSDTVHVCIEDFGVGTK